MYFLTLDKNKNLTEISINLTDINPVDFFGANNANLTKIRKAFPRLKIASRGNKMKINGNEGDIVQLKETIDAMLQLLEKYGSLSSKNMENILLGVEPADHDTGSHSKDIILYGPYGNVVKSRTVNQRRMVELSYENDIVFATGPAGTGKTYTAVALAVRALKNKQVKRIVLTRPAVEAGESLGFLPGDLKEKIDPYLRPLYDALDDMVPIDKLNYYMQNRIIEVAPLAFMRGRTLDHAFIILDEAQNTTISQIKMFLTRIGPSAKAIINGDLTQIDLPRNQKSGLIKVIDILKNIEGIGMIHLTEKDVIRHKLVRKIINAFNKDIEKNEDS
jgi:phosphate starvation-inducible protein PhoH and related proteins